MKSLKKIVAIIGAVSLLSSQLVWGAEKESTSTSNQLVQLKSEQQLIKVLTEKGIIVEKNNVSDYEIENSLSNRVPMTQDITTSDMMTTNAAESSSLETIRSETNVQELGVDEADVLKNDGRYIYKIIDTHKITIMDTQPGLHIEGSIEDEQIEFNNMFLDGNQLIAIGNVYNVNEQRKKPLSLSSGKCVEHITKNYTKVRIYDVSKPSEPKLSREIAMEGKMLTARKIENQLYLVTNPGLVRKFKGSYTEEDLLPSYKDSLLGDKTQLINISDIYDVPWGNSRYFMDTTLLTTISLKENKALDIKMLLGGTRNVYMNQDAMFLELYGQKSSISRFDVVGQCLSYVGTGMIEGYLYNQFAMDLYEGYLRVATTSYDYPSYEMTNNLFIFDKYMNQVGVLKNLAPTEKIYSARFEGKIGYLVTYKQMDPLFVLDLSNPKAPKVKGQLKIPGVSTYLHPISDHLVVGIGRATLDEEGGSSKYQDSSSIPAGIKLALFDVSDQSNPKEVNKIILGTCGTESSALNNHKAVTVHKGKAMLAIPISIRYNKERDLEDFYGAYVFAVENGKLVGKAKLGRVNNSKTEDYYYYYNTDRVCYIGDKLYFLYDDKINEYDIDTFKRLQTLSLK